MHTEENTMAKEQSENRTTHVILQKSDIGQVIIEDEVISIIAGLAAVEVEGVHSMAGNITKELVSKLGVSNLSRGVKIEIAENSVSAYMALNINFGYNIPQVATLTQEKVKAAVENMTGFQVSEVNIHIAGVIVDRDRP